MGNIYHLDIDLTDDYYNNDMEGRSDGVAKADETLSNRRSDNVTK